MRLLHVKIIYDYDVITVAQAYYVMHSIHKLSHGIEELRQRLQWREARDYQPKLFLTLIVQVFYVTPLRFAAISFKFPKVFDVYYPKIG